MSYILDALRKSDQQRRRGAAPTLLPAQLEAAAPKRPKLLAFGVLALVLLGAGFAAGWLRPWQQEPAPVAAAKSSAPAPSQAPAAALESAPTAQREALPQIAAATPPVVAPLPPAATATAPAPTVAPAAAPVPAAVSAQAAPEPGLASRSAAATTAGDAAKKPAAPERISGPAGVTSAPAVSPVMAMNDLPLAIQQELPPMSISVHAYSAKPAERLIGINNRLLREGDEVAPGLRLEQITPGGMVLGYKGYSFRRGVH